MKPALLIILWVLTLGALVGCVGWLEMRFNMLSWDPKPGIFSFLPYFVIIGLLTATIFISAAVESLSKFIILLMIAAIPLIYGMILLPEEETVGKTRGKEEAELDLGPNPSFLTVLSSAARSFHKAIEEDPNWLKRHDGETSPFWYRFHRSAILAFPFFVCAWHLWQARRTAA